MIINQILAASINNPLLSPEGQSPETAVNFIGRVINVGLTILFIAAFLLFVIILLWGGIEFILSGGDKEKAAAAKTRFNHALLGIGLTLLTFVFVNFIGYLFDIDLLRLKIPTLTPRPIEQEDGTMQHFREDAL